MKIKCLIISILLLFLGCKTFIAKKIFHIGQEMKFETKNQLEVFLQEKFQDTAVDFFYVDSTFYGKLLSTYSMSSKYGSQLINGIYRSIDSVLKVDTTNLLKQSCAGKNATAIDSIVKIGKENLTFLLSNDLISLNLRPLNKSKQFVIEKDKLTLLIYYYYPFGKMYDSFYKEVLKIKKNHPSINLGVIVLDPVYRLK